jgi:hypothetical protein
MVNGKFSATASTVGAHETVPDENIFFTKRHSVDVKASDKLQKAHDCRDFNDNAFRGSDYFSGMS